MTSPSSDRPEPVVSVSVPVVPMLGLGLARLDTVGVLDHLFASLDAGVGGVLLTANLDILRRFAREPAARAIYEGATMTIADGAPLVWASHLAGMPLPERVAGASLVPRIAERAVREHRSIYLLGGEADDAAVAAHALVRANPGLVVAGHSSPRIACPPEQRELDPIAAELARTHADIVLVAMGSPKQEALAVALAPLFPRVWFMGVGASLAFAGGRIRRAPSLMQSLGIEWVHRLALEPRRLGRRYLIEGLPFAAELFVGALKARASAPRAKS